MSGPDAIVGVSDHGGWAVLVIVASDGTLVDRRNVELVDKHLLSIPHHHEGQILTIDEAVALVEKVRDSANRRAILALDAVATALPVRIVGIALRECPQLPPHHCRAHHQLPGPERRRLGYVSQGARRRSRGARLERALVQCQGSIRRGAGCLASR